jgi:outer membrane receptor protein involved in Fe transport
VHHRIGPRGLEGEEAGGHADPHQRRHGHVGCGPAEVGRARDDGGVGDLRDLESQISEELTFSSKAGEKLDWQAGLYYFHADGSYDPSGVYSNVLFGPFTYVAPYGRQVTESEAVFAQGSYEIIEATKLTLGARYTHEGRDVSGQVYCK